MRLPWSRERALYSAAMLVPAPGLLLMTMQRKQFLAALACSGLALAAGPAALAQDKPLEWVVGYAAGGGSGGGERASLFFKKKKKKKKEIKHIWL